MITIFGDSHVSAISYVKNVTHNLNIQLLGTHGVNWREFEITETPSCVHVSSERVPNSTPVDLEIRTGGKYYFSSPLHSAPYFRDQAWQKFCPWKCSAIYPELTPVSDALIQTWVESTMRCRTNLLERLLEKQIDISIIEPPKPLMRVPSYKNIKPEVVLEVDQLVRGFVFSLLQRKGIPVIQAPKETIQNGFTKEEFSAPSQKDGHHGSTGYYELLLRKIIEDCQNKRG